jgi:hypothetical protein
MRRHIFSIRSGESIAGALRNSQQTSRRRTRAAIALTIAAVASANAQLVNSAWNTGSGTWNLPANWTPLAVPDNGAPLVTNTYNVSIGSLAIANGAQVTFIPRTGTNSTISTLTVSNNADLLTNAFQLNVLGAAVVDGAGTTIRVDPHTSPGTAALTALSLNLNNGGGLTMAGGIATVSGGQLEINASSVLGGHGTVNVGDADGAIEQAFDNSALLQPQSNTAAPQTLTIHANGVDTIDLDGDSETGVVDVDNAMANVNADTVTLIIDGPLSDPFGGLAGAQIQVGQRDTLTFTKDFQIFGPAAISMTGGNNVATINGAGNITDIQGATFTITNAAVINNNMTFTGTANTLNVNANSSLELGGTVNIADASMINLAASSSELIISGNTNVTELAGEFNWDGTGVSTTTIKGSGQLTLNVNRVDNGDDLYGGTLNLDDNGNVTVNNVANIWTMAGTIHKRNSGTSSILGDAMNVSGSVVVDTGTLNVPVTTLSPGANLTLNGVLSLAAGSTLAGPTSITGTGTLRMAGSSTVSANTTVNTSLFDWDGSGAGTLHTINEGIVFTINSSTWDADDAGDMDDPINIGGSGGQLIVNNVPNWTMNRTITANTSGLGISTIGGNSRLTLSGSLAILNANGQLAVNAPITFGTSSVANIVSPGYLRMNGGDSLSVFNRIEGATINGPGNLVAINDRELRGFGTINAPIVFQNSSALRADDGVLTIGGTITEAANLGTADADGILNVVNAWNSNVATNVVLRGGEIQGGAITVGNANGIKGNGLVSARVVNNTRLEATDSGKTLAFQTAANDNDWDGGSNLGVLAASNGATLELRDNATFTYGGTVNATNGSRVYSKGFGFNYFNTSILNLSESTIEGDETTTINGTVNVGAGLPSTLKVQVNRFLDIKSTSTLNLNGDLRLESNNGHIEAGATFNGNGAIIVPEGSHLVPEANANLNVLLRNEGAIRPGDFEGIGRVDLRDYEQKAASGSGNSFHSGGQLYEELTGTSLNQYDRLVVFGVAQLGGYLNIDIDAGFVPALGNTFNIISAPGGVIGKFDTVDISGFPPGLTVHVNYQSTFVQLQVVNTPNFAADFDDDGDVDMTDYAIWSHAYMLNQLGDANGDHISDASDWTIWRDEFGAMPGPYLGEPLGTVPEPGTGAVMALAGALVGLRRRRARRKAKSLIAMAALGALGLSLPSVSQAAPALTVLDNGINASSHREFLVKIAPDPALFLGGQGSVAAEFGFQVTAGSLIGVTVNTTDWPADIPGKNPYDAGSFTTGLSIKPAAAFASFGSNLFTSATPVLFLKIETSTSPVTLNWGQYTIGGHMGARIAQGGNNYDGYQGSISITTLPGDFDLDGDLDNVDIDTLLHATQGPIPPAQAKFDLNSDNVVIAAPYAPNSDSDVWVQTLRHTRYGDANLDGRVNSQDFAVLASHYNQSGQGWAEGDFNGNGKVNALDFNQIAKNFGFIAPGDSLGAIVPEPGVATMLIALLLLQRRRRI